jgi:uncharacterized protein YraI
MSLSRFAIAAVVLLVSDMAASAEPAYVTSTVNLRSGPGTNHEIVTKIPGGSLVDASQCGEWCEVNWRGAKGFAIASVLDRSGRVPAVSAPRRAIGPPSVIYDDVIVDPLPIYRPRVYYGYRPYYYRPYRGYRSWRYY